MDTQKSFDAETSDVKTKLLYASPVEACKLMNSDMKGLTQSEAGRRLETYGKNELPKKKQDSLLKKLLANFTSLMALLLWRYLRVALWPLFPVPGTWDRDLLCKSDQRSLFFFSRI